MTAEAQSRATHSVPAGTLAHRGMPAAPPAGGLRHNQDI
jgi:hypothetical protein